MLLMRLGCWLPLLIVLAPIVIVVASIVAVFRGSPGECGDGREVRIDPLLAFSYDERWVAFNQQLTFGQPASLTVSESEATSRARVFLDAADAPIDDARLCFTEGGADATGTLDTPFGGDIAVRVKGDADLSGEHPRARIDSIKLGAMPAWATRPFHGLVTRIIDDQTDDIAIDHRIAVDVRDGEAVISGTP